MSWVTILIIICIVSILTFIFIQRRKINKMNKLSRIRRDNHNSRMKEYKARAIIGGEERTGSGIETLSIYKCKKCGYTLRSTPQGFFKLSSEVYYNFKCVPVVVVFFKFMYEFEQIYLTVSVFV